MVILGLEAWASGSLEDFGKLIAASGRSSIVNYECGMPRLSYINYLTRASYSASFFRSPGWGILKL